MEICAEHVLVDPNVRVRDEDFVFQEHKRSSDRATNPFKGELVFQEHKRCTIGAWERALFDGLPGYMWLFRNWLYWRQEVFGIGYTLKPEYLKFAEGLALRYLREAVPDPAD